MTFPDIWPMYYIERELFFDSSDDVHSLNLSPLSSFSAQSHHTFFAF
jgi:hypothetical protein